MHLKLSRDEFKHETSNSPNIEQFREYMTARAVDNPIFRDTVRKTVVSLPLSIRSQLRALLGFMTTHLGSLVSTGYWSAINAQPLNIREAILHSWENSWLSLWTTLAKTFTLMAKVAWCRADPLFLQLNNYSIPSQEPGPTLDFDFVQFEASPEPAVIETDVVIVGSGCGGGVCARVLAEAGHRVLVVDKGYYYPPNQLPVEAKDLLNLWEGGGLSTVDGSVMVTAGKCWGGGGVINWSASLHPQQFVREEWAAGGLGFFTSQEFQDCLDRVCDALGVTDANIKHNHSNRVLLEGAEKLGWGARSVPQNTEAGHECGCHCGLGCRAANKKSPAVSWLPTAARTGRARFIEGLDISRVTFDDDNVRVGKATGVIGKWTSRDQDGKMNTEKPKTKRDIHIKAKKVVISSGALNSPLILLRSGLKNPNIGRHLHLHPLNSLTAVFREPIKGWQGEIVTSLVSEFEDLDGHGHGAKIEPCSMLPLMTLTQLPWQGGLQFKIDALKYQRMNAYMSIIRDRDTGYVFSNPENGSPAIGYTVSKFDRRSIITGLIGSAKICYIQGATEIFSGIPGIESFRSSKPAEDRSLNDPEFVKWVTKLERADLKPSSAVLNSGHQMSTCRMSKSSEHGVVDESGKAFGTENLYIADSSVFPSTTGNNPMITIMAIADHIARGISGNMN
ncbi:long-chain fatty alcohol dehydrogenase [Hypoxylon trugodes]|uniref:long-chain fatty alcohol dehydrogenase n=1 Tax=Hypoxylon trugodes TaxID=326681 RepID=UPI00219C432E|nr:long-chain fatty alcohol dehydrogenase [Hypoxylon trugodes]KAI1392651.1 long-chain fatty alcohol dehydrogenase [Hypoxylon trugodes]